MLRWRKCVRSPRHALSHPDISDTPLYNNERNPYSK
jgi:hypothetical protein